MIIDSLVPLVVSTPKHADSLQTKKNELEKLEFKLDTGQAGYMSGWIQDSLDTGQAT